MLVPSPPMYRPPAGDPREGLRRRDPLNRATFPVGTSTCGLLPRSNAVGHRGLAPLRHMGNDRTSSAIDPVPCGRPARPQPGILCDAPEISHREGIPQKGPALKTLHCDAREEKRVDQRTGYDILTT